MKIAVIGAGSFGTALAKLLAENGHTVSMWSHSLDTVEEIQKNHENTIYLPGYRLPDNLSVSHDLPAVFKDAELVVSAVPTQATRQVWQNAIQYLPEDADIVAASKGIEKGTHKLVSELFVDVAGNKNKHKLFFLSGPSFAKEIAGRIPTAITIAGYRSDGIQHIQEAFKSDYFRTYGTEDVTGVELGGALKNVMALATGISDGLGLGHNTRAAIITRGLAEIARLGNAMGADPLTFMGLAGMGDLVLTCTGDLSRNRTVGLKLGEGMKLQAILDSMRMVAEGVPTTESAYELAAIKKVEMPITSAVYRILYEDKPPADTIKELMTRRLKFESDHS